MRDYNYFAFISYRSTDREWAQWLQHMLEHYHLPSVINGRELPDSLYPIFLDTSELSGGTLGRELAVALESSKYLIVLCSPESAQSEWVDKEVQSFIDRGQVNRVIPFIVAGTPYSADDNCFVPALTRLRGSEMEQLGISVSENGREPAAVKVIARMLGLRFNDLWKRLERDKEAERLRLVETNNRIRRNLARFVAEKSMGILEQGDAMTAMRLALEVLPLPENPDFPFTAEAEGALRRSIRSHNRNYRGFATDISCMALHPDGTKVAFADDEGSIRLFEIASSREIFSIQWQEEHDYPTSLAFHPDGTRLVLGTQKGNIRVWDTTTWQQIELDKSADCVNFDDVNSIAFTPDGLHMVTAYRAGFSIWDTDTFDWHGYVDRERDFCDQGICISPDGQYILCAGVDLSMYTFGIDQPKQIWKVRSRCRSNAIFSPDGSSVICTSASQISSYDAKTGHKTASFNLETHPQRLMFTSDGSMIMGNNMGRVSFFLFSLDRNTDALAECFTNIEHICAVLPCNEFRSFLVLGFDETIGIQKLIRNPYIYGVDHDEDFLSFDDNNRPVITDYDHRATQPESFRVSLHNNHGNTTVTVTDTQGNVIGQIESVPFSVKHYALTPDGRYIALFQDNACEIWSVRDGVCVDVPDLKSEWVEDQAAFSPDGRTLAVLAQSAEIITFEFRPLNELTEEARAKCANMTFTDDERRKYYLD